MPDITLYRTDAVLLLNSIRLYRFSNPALANQCAVIENKLSARIAQGLHPNEPAAKPAASSPWQSFTNACYRAAHSGGSNG